MAKRVDLFIVDPQVDFCDPAGALYVPGADTDMKRLAAFINRTGEQLYAIHISLDSHHSLDIAHPLFWKDAEGNHPQPFTVISPADVAAGKWQTMIPKLAAWGRKYLAALDANGRYPLVIWPYHCLIGSRGHTVYPPLFDAVSAWERAKLKPVEYIIKGSNIYTEHYSVIRADVPDEDDPATRTNTLLIRSLEECDLILVAGEAGSHCVANTVQDLADGFSNKDAVRKIVLLSDTISPVTGYQELQERFISKMTARGMQLSTTTAFQAEQGGAGR